MTKRSRYTASAIVVALAVLTLGGAPAIATHALCGGHDGQPLIIGCQNEAHTETYLFLDGANNGAEEAALYVDARTDYSTAIAGSANASDSLGGIGVSGMSSGTGGIGVWGLGQIGVKAEAGSTGETALSVVGKATFTRSGKLTITAGKVSVAKTGVALTSASVILATVQNNLAGVWVTRAVQTTATSFTVYLNKAVPAGKTVTVGWFVVN